MDEEQFSQQQVYNEEWKHEKESRGTEYMMSHYSTPLKPVLTCDVTNKGTPQSEGSGHSWRCGPINSTPGAGLQVPVAHLPSVSPLLHTPHSGAVSSHRIPARYRHPSTVTPCGTLNTKPRITPRFSSCSHTTPGGTNYKSVKKNPFEGHLLERISSEDAAMFSPDMFKVVEPGSAEKTPKSFRWSIDQIAVLKPADIDELPLQTDTLNVIVPEVEARAQCAIDKYFDQGYIVPSPWTNEVKFVLPRTPGVELDADVQQQVAQTPSVKAATVTMKDACCQTQYTIPVNCDLTKILGNEFVYHSEPVTAGGSGDSSDPGVADVSSSSLRRKLFFHGDEGTPLSPVRCMSRRAMTSEVMDMSSPAVSPVQYITDTPVQGQLQDIQTPSTGQFSSSPIRGLQMLHTPQLRRCSTAPNMADIASPHFSPIQANTPETGVNTEGLTPIGVMSRETCLLSPVESVRPNITSVCRPAQVLQPTTKDKISVPSELQRVKTEGHNKQVPCYHDDENARDADMSCDEGIECGVTKVVGSSGAFTAFRDNVGDLDATSDVTLGYHSTIDTLGSQTHDTGYQTGHGLSQLQSTTVNQTDSATNITGHFSCLQPPWKTKLAPDTSTTLVPSDQETHSHFNTKGLLNISGIEYQGPDTIFNCDTNSNNFNEKDKTKNIKSSILTPDNMKRKTLFSDDQLSSNASKTKAFHVDSLDRMSDNLRGSKLLLNSSDVSSSDTLYSHMMSTPTSSAKYNAQQPPTRVLFADQLMQSGNAGMAANSEDVVLSKRPSSLIFSELESLARRPECLTESHSCSNTPTAELGQASCEPVLSKSRSTSDVTHCTTRHSRLFTHGSMINHQQVYEPPPLHRKPDHKAIQAQRPTAHGVLSRQVSLPSTSSAWKKSASRLVEETDDVQNFTSIKPRVLLSQDNTSQHLFTDLQASCKLRTNTGLSLGRSARSNPAFTIETLTAPDTTLPSHVALQVLHRAETDLQKLREGESDDDL